MVEGNRELPFTSLHIQTVVPVTEKAFKFSPGVFYSSRPTFWDKVPKLDFAALAENLVIIDHV